MPLPHPDRFDLLSPEVVEDPYPFYASLREHAPVYRVPHTQVRMVSTWDLVDEALERPEDFSSHLTGVLMRGEDGRPVLFDMSPLGAAIQAIATADDPEHAVHRRLVQPLLTPRRVNELEPLVRDWAREAIAPLAADGGGDWVEAAADPLPARAMARLIGFPDEDRKDLVAWSMGGGAILAGTGRLQDLAVHRGLNDELNVYVVGRLKEEMEGPGGDPETQILAALVRGVRAGLIDRAYALGILVTLVGAGGESTASLIGSSVRLLAERGDLQDDLRARPGRIPAFVEEVTRLETAFKGHYRVVRHDTALGGCELPGDSRLMLMWASANRDDAEFANPDEIDLDRPVPRHHLGFGRGTHFCVGAPLARMEARVVLEELLERTRRFEIDPDRPPAHVSSIFIRRLDHLHLRVEAS